MDDDDYVPSDDATILPEREPSSAPDGWDNLAELFGCFDRSWGTCAYIADINDSTLLFAIVVAVALNLAGVWLATVGFLSGFEMVTHRVISNNRPVLATSGVAIGFLWFHLWLTHALPEVAGQNFFAWMLTGPLFTLVLMLGVALLVIGVGYVFSTVAAINRRPDRRGSRGNPIVDLTESRWRWGLLLAGVTGVLIGWHFVYASVPEVANGPFDDGPIWLQHAMGLWPLRLPVGMFWAVASVLASVPGIVVFGVLGVLSLILLRPSVQAWIVQVERGVVIGKSVTCGDGLGRGCSG